MENRDTVRHLADLVAAIRMAGSTVAGTGDAEQRMATAFERALAAFTEFAESLGLGPWEWGMILSDAFADAEQAD